MLAVGLSACAAPLEGDELAPGDPAVRSSAIIYDRDDRLEVYEHPDSQLRALAQSSLVALVPRRHFARTTSGNFAIFTRPLEQAFRVCSDARFALQPTAADCSGTLIDDDLVLTAGHCFASDDACERFAFMFDYFYASEDKLEPVGWGDVYGCRRIVDRQVSATGTTPRIDYAVVQLDRPAVGRAPAPLRTTPLAVNEALSTMGCVSGLPAKIDSGARVLSTRAPSTDFFLLDSDTFQGSSGSGVFDQDAQLIGVLVRGGEDYEDRPDAACRVPKVVNTLSDAGLLNPSIGEEATYVGRILEGVCATGWPSARLCGKPARCGDGFCSAGETRALCAQDCTCSSDTCARATVDTMAQSAIEKSPAADDGCAVLARGERPGNRLLPAMLLALGSLLTRRRATRRSRA